MNEYIKWGIITFGLFIMPIVFGSVYGLIAIVVFSIYGVHTLIHLLLQSVFGIKSRLQVQKTDKPVKLGLQIVGYREDETFYKYAIESIRQSLHHLSVVICVSDGNEVNDHYMAEIPLHKMKNATHRVLNTNLSKMSQAEQLHWMEECKLMFDNGIKVFCISQPHSGKREAMYVAMLLQNALGMEYSLFMDSDTILMPNAIKELKKVIVNDSQVGAVTGDVRIFTINNWLSFITYFKYWTSFNFERASQSYFNVVSCVSGPLGMYRLTALIRVIEEWRTQTFLGKECTYGDDRHLTNLLLKYGYRVKYNHKAIAYTETPEKLSRFCPQQIRWGKSFLREFILNIRWFGKHNIWLAYDLTFQFLYRPLFTVFAIFLLIQGSSESITYLYVSIILVSLFKGIIATILTRSFIMLYFSFYGLLYLFLMIPIGITSAVTLKDTDWGTGNRKFGMASKSLYDKLYYPIVAIWNGFVLWRTVVGLLKIDSFEVHVWFLIVTSSIIVVQLMFYPWVRQRLYDNIQMEMLPIVSNADQTVNFEVPVRQISRVIQQRSGELETIDV